MRAASHNVIPHMYFSNEIRSPWLDVEERFLVGERQWFTQIHELETTWIYVSSVQGGPTSYQWSLGAPINDLIFG